MVENHIAHCRSNDNDRGMSVVVAPRTGQHPGYGLITGTNLRPTELLSNIVTSTSLLNPNTMPLANLVRNVRIISDVL
jgi:hypothetical protein